MQIFVAPKLYYMDENQNSQEFTSDKRAMETMQLIPDGGSSHDYEFSYAAGELEVKHHVLRDGNVIEGKKVKRLRLVCIRLCSHPPGGELSN